MASATVVFFIITLCSGLIACYALRMGEKAKAVKISKRCRDCCNCRLWDIEIDGRDSFVCQLWRRDFPNGEGCERFCGKRIPWKIDKITDMTVTDIETGKVVIKIDNITDHEMEVSK